MYFFKEKKLSFIYRINAKITSEIEVNSLTLKHNKTDALVLLVCYTIVLRPMSFCHANPRNNNKQNSSFSIK